MWCHGKWSCLSSRQFLFLERGGLLQPPFRIEQWCLAVVRTHRTLSELSMTINVTATNPANKILTAPTLWFTFALLHLERTLNLTKFSLCACHRQGCLRGENFDWFMGPCAAQEPCNMTGIRYLLFQVRSELLTWGPEFLAARVVIRPGRLFKSIFLSPACVAKAKEMLDYFCL